MPLYWDTPGLRFDEGYHWDQVEDFPLKPGEVAAPVSVSPSVTFKPTQARRHRMNDKQRNQVNRFIRVIKFADANAPKFTNTPAKPGDDKFNEIRTTKFPPLRAEIRKHQTTQQGGASHQETTNQERERQDIRDLMSTTNRTMRPIAKELNNPGLMDRFRIPPNGSDEQLKAAARAFAEAIAELNLAPHIAAHGYEGDLAADLLAEVEDLDNSEGDQSEAQGNEQGATKSLPGLLKKERDLVEALDVIIRNRFRNDPEMLAKWRVASHIVATLQGQDEDEGGGGTPTPAPTPPTP